jgi:SAM-dependent methyltransferase
VPDAIFDHPRMARIYDDLEGERDDLDHYETIVAELGARRVLDVGCGTGELACRLSRRGVDVVGVDPATASLDVARGKPGSDRVRWICGDATSMPAPAPGDLVDLAVMTANVAQVFLTDDDWRATLAAVRTWLAPEGRLVFETRVPARHGWEEWTRDRSFEVCDTVAGRVETWVDLREVSLPFVTFECVVRFLDDGTELVSSSTLRFRDLAELEQSLAATGFIVDQVRDAPDRPGREWVVFATPARPSR